MVLCCDPLAIALTPCEVAHKRLQRATPCSLLEHPANSNNAGLASVQESYVFCFLPWVAVTNGITVCGNTTMIGAGATLAWMTMILLLIPVNGKNQGGFLPAAL
jgi:hypothetical protein